MSLELEDVQRIALLARIAIEPGEAGGVVDGLNRVMDLIGEMQAVDTGGIEPMSHPLEVTQRLREDRVGGFTSMATLATTRRACRACTRVSSV